MATSVTVKYFICNVIRRVLVKGSDKVRYSMYLEGGVK